MVNTPKLGNDPPKLMAHTVLSNNINKLAIVGTMINAAKKAQQYKSSTGLIVFILNNINIIQGAIRLILITYHHFKTITIAIHNNIYNDSSDGCAMDSYV